jgi:hypothetical protein
MMRSGRALSSYRADILLAGALVIKQGDAVTAVTAIRILFYYSLFLFYEKREKQIVVSAATGVIHPNAS